MSVYAIIGGAGFLGAAAAARLAGAGHTVRILDLLTTPASRARAEELSRLPHLDMREGDGRRADPCRSLCSGADYALHFAGAADEEDARAHVEAAAQVALTLLEVCGEAKTLKRLVFASTSEIYGDGPGMSRHEGAIPEPISPRACAAMATEHLLRSAYRRSGTPTVCLRFFDCYGPGMTLDPMRGSALGRLLAAARGIGPAHLPKSSDAGWDHVYRDDAVDATVRACAAARGVGGKAFNVGSGKRTALPQLIDAVETASGQPLRCCESDASGWFSGGRADVAAAAGVLQFCSAWSLEEGLAQTWLSLSSSGVKQREALNA